MPVYRIHLLAHVAFCLEFVAWNGGCIILPVPLAHVVLVKAGHVSCLRCALRPLKYVESLLIDLALAQIWVVLSHYVVIPPHILRYFWLFIILSLWGEFDYGHRHIFVMPVMLLQRVSDHMVLRPIRDYQLRMFDRRRLPTNESTLLAIQVFHCLRLQFLLFLDMNQGLDCIEISLSIVLYKSIMGALIGDLPLIMLSGLLIGRLRRQRRDEQGTYYRHFSLLFLSLLTPRLPSDGDWFWRVAIFMKV